MKTLLILLLCTAAPAATYYVGPAATGDGSGSDRSNLMALGTANAGDRHGDTFLLQPGPYGGVTFTAYGSADANCVFQADAGTVTARDTAWYENDIDRRTTAEAPCFTGVTIASRAGGQYLDLDGLVVLDGYLNLGGANVAHVQIANCDCFSVVPADPVYHRSQDRTANGVSLYNSGTTDRADITIDSCYFEGYRSGITLLGDFGDDMRIIDCHVVNFSSAGVYLNTSNTSADRNAILVDGCHVHDQNAKADSEKGSTTVAAPGSPADMTFTYVADPTDTTANWVGVTHGGATAYRPATIAQSTNTVYCAAALPWDVTAGDVVAFYNGDHGGGILIRSHCLTIQNCRVHDCGASGPVYNYVDGVTDVKLYNNLVYAPHTMPAVNFSARRAGAGCVFINNTVTGRRQTAYATNGVWRYGLACQISITDSGVIVANNVFAGRASAYGTIANNIVYSDLFGSFGATDYIYCAQSSYPPGTEPRPFETGQGFFVGGVGFDDLLQSGGATNANAMFNYIVGAQPIDFAAAAYATATDFRGQARSTPDAGHFEYVVADAEAPDEVTGLSPADGATDVAFDTGLAWDEAARALSYNVYFGTTSPPASIGNQAGTTYDPGSLAYDTTYYVRIDSVNVTGTTAGTEISWTTESAPASPAAVILIVED